MKTPTGKDTPEPILCREVYELPEFRMLLAYLGIDFDEERVLGLKLTFGTPENPVVVEHSHLAGRALSAGEAASGGGADSTTPGSQVSRGVNRDRYEAAVKGQPLLHRGNESDDRAERALESAIENARRSACADS